MTITGSGRVAIGKTSPLYKFEVLDNSSGLFAAYIFKDYNSNSYGGLGIQAGATDGVGTNMMISVYNRNGAYKGGLAIVNNGNAQLVTSSDLKLKNNVKKTSIHGLDLIKRLNVVDFEYKDSPGIQQIGYIAQEVKEVFPSMVSFNEMENILQISTMSLIPVLNKAIQEQQTIIESQNEEIKLLRAEMEEIKRLIQK
jgi:PHP family Zn ribbon phosphoesterase